MRFKNKHAALRHPDMPGHKTAIETDFPFAELSRVAEAESWRKELNRPLAHIHKW